MSASGMAAVAAATDSVSKTTHEAAVAAAREEGRTAGFAAGRTEGLTAGATAERERLLGIEAHAIPGHEALIAACKADSSVTPDMAAGRILGAEKALRANQLAGIQAVEDQTGKVGAAAASQRRDDGAVQPPKEGEAKSADAYKADYAKSAALQGDFASADAYANYAKGVAEGRIRVLKAPVAAAS